MKTSRQPLILLILLAVSVGWALVCTLAGGLISPLRTLSRLSPYLLAFALLFLAFSPRKQMVHRLLFIALCCYAIIECGLGTAQLAGWVRSRHDYYQLTGNFLNPAPYACFLGASAVCCAVKLLRRNESTAVNVLAVVTLVWSIVMVVAAQSRAVWLGLVLALLAALVRETELVGRIRHKTLVFSIGAVLFLTGCFGAWMLKPVSAEARLSIWRTDCLVISEHPLMGVGPGAEMGAFGDAQSRYFHSHVRSPHRQELADVPQFPFNEFLKMGMACGIPGLMLALAVFGIALSVEIRHRRLYAYPLIVLGTFALFSFALCQMALSLLLVLALADAVTIGGSFAKRRKYQAFIAVFVVVASVPLVVGEARHRVLIRDFVDEHLGQELDYNEIAAYYERLKDEPSFLALYSNALYDESLYGEALQVVGRLERMKADPAVPVLRGEICRLTGDFAGAADAFVKAYYMAPSRLTALKCLITLYRQCGLDNEAARTKAFALSLPVDSKYAATMEVRKQIEDL